MPATAEPTPTRTRVNSYQARIERSLTDHYYEVPDTAQANREWILTHVAHTNGYAICELCGHNPIKRLFFIRNRTTEQELMIGSECARNYASVDLVDAYMRRLQRDQNRVREDRRREERRAAYRERQAHYHEEAAARQEADRQTFAANNAELVAWIAFQPDYENHPENNSFVASVIRQYRDRGTLSPRQVEVLDRIRREEAERAEQAGGTVGDQAQNRSGNARDRAATPDDLPHIYNGDYTITNLQTSEHLTFQIYTPRRGALQGLRIIKRMVAGSSFTGFAFLDRDGGLAIWRRFRQDENTQYVEYARALLRILNRNVLAQEGDDTLYDTQYSPLWRIERSRRCRRCNIRLTTPTSIHAGIGPECQRRTAEETRAASPFTVVTANGAYDPNGEVPLPNGTYQVTGDGPVPYEPGTTATVHNTEPVRPAPRRRTRRTDDGMLLSELGSGEVL